MRNIIALVITVVFITFCSCDRVKNKTKNAINKSGEIVGQASTEFFHGVAKGVEETLDRQIVVSDNLQQKGFQIGRTIIDDTLGGTNNVLIIYGIFNKPFHDTLRVKVFGPDGIEIGRSKQTIQSEAGDAHYLNVNFDRRTYIEKKSRIEIE